MKKGRILAYMSISLALGMILSYVEFLLPPIYAAVPGIKLGLANIAVMFLLYKCGPWQAFVVSMLRVALSSLLFGSPLTLAYSLSGAILSFIVMVLLKKASVFTTCGVSAAAAVSHNVGQILMAIFILGTKEIAYYLIPLTVSGTIAGVAVGIVSAILIKKIDVKKNY
jgi:heptaprenyl diphosphate synthase